MTLSAFQETLQKAFDKKLNPESEDWLLKDTEGITVIEHYLRVSKLPRQFKNWHWKVNAYGTSVAHIAAQNNRLQNLSKNDKFIIWSITDHSGWSVSHTLGFNGFLPSYFQHWCLKDISGWNVAMVTAVSGHLKENSTGVKFLPEAMKKLLVKKTLHPALPIFGKKTGFRLNV
jgi:hypothetical protein